MAHLYPTYDLAQMTVSSTGTGTLTLNSAYTGLLTFDTAGCSTSASGQDVSYAIIQSSLSEINRGTYYSSAMQLVRSSTTYIRSNNSNSPIDMSNTALVAIAMGSFDFKITPTISVLTSPGSGTYTPPLACIAIEIIGVGGGQGGQGETATLPTAGGDTTFALSTSTLTANGGSSTIGGSASGGNIANRSGGSGVAPNADITNNRDYGGIGGNSFFGGAGAAGGTTGGNGTLGGGGGGSQNNNGDPFGTGGGAGGMFWHLEPISSISSALSFAYAVGAGSAGTTGGGLTGGTGGNGCLVIKEYYLG